MLYISCVVNVSLFEILKVKKFVTSKGKNGIWTDKTNSNSVICNVSAFAAETL